MEHGTQEEVIRFTSKYKELKDCLIWQSPLDKDGYGSFYFRKKNRRAHRVSYFLHKGNIPDGMVIDHICKNRNCVAIGHLRLVTQLQNTMENSRSVGAINKMKTHCKFGHPLDKKYGKQRYCSKCGNEKRIRLAKKWKAEADAVKC